MMDSSCNSSLDETGRELSSITEQEEQLYLEQKHHKASSEVTQSHEQQRIDSDVDTQPPEPKVKSDIFCVFIVYLGRETKASQLLCSRVTIASNRRIQCTLVAEN